MEKKLVLNFRQKLIIGLLDSFGGILSKTDFQKYLFLFTREFERTPSFDFIPYRFGCFSFQSYAEKRRLTELGILTAAENWQLAESFSANCFYDKKVFLHFCHRYAKLKGKDLVREVYHRYPYYAIHSEIAASIMDKAGLEAIEAARPRQKEMSFFTIGYEGASLDDYLNRLIKNNIHALIDVRRNPLSRKYGFSQKSLSEKVQQFDIVYLHVPELGIESAKRHNLQNFGAYQRLFDEYEELQLPNCGKALELLQDMLAKYQRIAITCFERDVCMCHRGRIAKAMELRLQGNYAIYHI